MGAINTIKLSYMSNVDIYNVPGPGIAFRDSLSKMKCHLNVVQSMTRHDIVVLIEVPWAQEVSVCHMCLEQHKNLPSVHSEGSSKPGIGIMVQFGFEESTCMKMEPTFE